MIFALNIHFYLLIIDKGLLIVDTHLNNISCSLLKIWNMNKCTGVVGVFNCQGAGWCKVIKKTRIHDASPGTLTGSVQADDVDPIAQVAGPNWDGETVVYAYRSGMCAHYAISYARKALIADLYAYHPC